MLFLIKDLGNDSKLNIQDFTKELKIYIYGAVFIVFI